LARTGHLGIITRPDELARVLELFLKEADVAAVERRRIG
jgi:hypothetical protein